MDWVVATVPVLIFTKHFDINMKKNKIPETMDLTSIRTLLHSTIIQEKLIDAPKVMSIDMWKIIYLDPLNSVQLCFCIDQFILFFSFWIIDWMVSMIVFEY